MYPVFDSVFRVRTCIHCLTLHPGFGPVSSVWPCIQCLTLYPGFGPVSRVWPCNQSLALYPLFDSASRVCIQGLTLYPGCMQCASKKCNNQFFPNMSARKKTTANVWHHFANFTNCVHWFFSIGKFWLLHFVLQPRGLLGWALSVHEMNIPDFHMSIN
jgi:hypothetical protein